MKFTHIEPFETHLGKNAAHHLPSVYGIALGSPFERKVIITELLKKIGGETVSVYLKKRTASLEALLNEINAPDLLLPKRVFIYDRVDGPREKSDLIAETLCSLPPNTRVIWADDEIHFYQLMDKKMILLDLSKETPRARFLRIERWIIWEVQKQGKSLTKEARLCLLDRFMIHFECLMREVQKLITYVGKCTEIDLKAVRAICNVRAIQTASWEVAKAIIWDEKNDDSAFSHLSIEEFFPFLGQLRYHLQLGLVITSCLKREREEEIGRAYPKLSAKMLARYKRLAQPLSVHYFREGLKHLFEMQLQVLEQAVSPPIIMTQFVARLKRGIDNA